SLRDLGFEFGIYCAGNTVNPELNRRIPHSIARPRTQSPAPVTLSALYTSRTYRSLRSDPTAPGPILFIMYEIVSLRSGSMMMTEPPQPPQKATRPPGTDGIDSWSARPKPIPRR